MKRYYMEIIEGKVNIHVVSENDRHKIWKQYPNAKEISREMYLDLTKAMVEHNKKVEKQEEIDREDLKKIYYETMPLHLKIQRLFNRFKKK